MPSYPSRHVPVVISVVWHNNAVMYLARHVDIQPSSTIQKRLHSGWMTVGASPHERSPSTLPLTSTKAIHHITKYTTSSAMTHLIILQIHIRPCLQHGLYHFRLTIAADMHQECASLLLHTTTVSNIDNQAHSSKVTPSCMLTSTLLSLSKVCTGAAIIFCITGCLKNFVLSSVSKIEWLAHMRAVHPLCGCKCSLDLIFWETYSKSSKHYPVILKILTSMPGTCNNNTITAV